MKSAILMIGLMLAAPVLGETTIYKCRFPDGRVVTQTTPCPPGSVTERTVIMSPKNLKPGQ